MNDARAAVLARIRSALSESAVPIEVPRAYRRTGRAGADMIGLFSERVSEYQATVQRVLGTNVADAIGHTLDAHGSRRVVVPDPACRASGSRRPAQRCWSTTHRYPTLSSRASMAR